MLKAIVLKYELADCCWHMYWHNSGLNNRSERVSSGTGQGNCSSAGVSLWDWHSKGQTFPLPSPLCLCCLCLQPAGKLLAYPGNHRCLRRTFNLELAYLVGSGLLITSISPVPDKQHSGAAKFKKLISRSGYTTGVGWPLEMRSSKL